VSLLVHVPGLCLLVEWPLGTTAGMCQGPCSSCCSWMAFAVCGLVSGSLGTFCGTMRSRLLLAKVNPWLGWVKQCSASAGDTAV